MFVEAGTEDLGQRLRKLGTERWRLPIDQLPRDLPFDQLPQVLQDLLREIYRSLGFEEARDLPIEENAPEFLKTWLISEVARIEAVLDLCRKWDLDGVPVFVPDGTPKTYRRSRPLFDFTAPQPWLFDNQAIIPAELGRAEVIALIDRSPFLFLVADIDDAIYGVYSLFGASVELAAASFRMAGSGSRSIFFTLSTASASVVVDGTFQHRTHWTVLGRTDASGSISQNLDCGYWTFRKATPPAVVDTGTHEVSWKRTSSAATLF
ncbi:hypothetical protein QO002_002630 [Pararhizobium capsulatum DSM 1112]|uniref:Uncharacterized protein n=1 Tax=Pararhizobium capsulatum DSM 1112 TaxID=1121113 RepID=A0ABU0BRB7_9HYPH|nr:hypothetical protein [Pararhizobium capsulatum]MDQ0320492.1 hypothetical protein [Pararhizobium capsulatum DSM 1112]